MSAEKKGQFDFGLGISDFGLGIFTLQIEECRLRKREAAKSRNSEANLSNGAGEGARRGKDRGNILII